MESKRERGECKKKGEELNFLPRPFYRKGCPPIKFVSLFRCIRMTGLVIDGKHVVLKEVQAVDLIN